MEGSHLIINRKRFLITLVTANSLEQPNNRYKLHEFGRNSG